MRAAHHLDSGAFLIDLKRRVAIQTESQRLEKRPELYRYLNDEIAPWLARWGFEIRTFDNPDSDGGPFLLATRHEHDDLPTLLTYGHGDVVCGMREQWRQGLDPWQIIVDGDRWFGRGTADNKGQHSIVMAALAMVIEERGKLNFNVKILIETSEEIGSPGLDVFCSTHQKLLAADVFIASDGPRMRQDCCDIVLGNRGSISFDLIVDLREGCQHSGHYGGVLEDAGMMLAHALTTITDKRGRILVPDWVPSSIPAGVSSAIKNLKIDSSDADLVNSDDWGEPGLTSAEKVLGWTSFVVLAFVAGLPDAPVNSVQSQARARCQVRFTADVERQKILPALRQHLDNSGFAQIQIRESGASSSGAWRTDPENPWVGWTLRSIEQTLGYPANLIPNASGGLPSKIFGDLLGIPVIWIPHSYRGCCQHGPNENLIPLMAREGLQIMTGLFWDLGEFDELPSRHASSDRVRVDS